MCSPAGRPSLAWIVHPFGYSAGPCRARSSSSPTTCDKQHYRTLQTMVIVGWKGQQRVFGTRGATEVRRALGPFPGSSYQDRYQRPHSMMQWAMANFFGLADLRYRHYRTLQTMVIVGRIAGGTIGKANFHQLPQDQ